MRIIAAIFSIAAAFTLSIFSQTTQAVAPIKWEKYRVSGSDISIDFPKLPVRVDSQNPCDEIRWSMYLAYAESSVYVLKVVTKYKSDNSYCTKKRKFGKDLFDSVIAVSRNAGGKETVSEIGDLKNVIVFDRSTAAHFYIDDLQKNRWIELSVLRRRKDPDREKSFVTSLRVGDPSKDGINIRKGSRVTLGDPESNSDITNPPAPTSEPGLVKEIESSDDIVAESKPDSGKGNESSISKPGDQKSPLRTPLAIIAKPKPSYTDLARFNAVQGTVLLRVTFLANGSVGAVTVVHGLLSGLSEEAVEAVRKVVFLPGRVDDSNVDLIKQVEYKFSIY